ncbi:MAG TPA: TraB/GumN family protein [Desulfobacteraceae bacterium]|nr:TraB/GumN family protein [Desulfobacteraceae bacterium]
MKIKRWITGLWIVLLTAAVTQAASPVWKISDGTRHLYIGGTIHVLAKDDYPLPKAFATAYADSHTLVFEADMGQMENPEFAGQMMAQMVYADGTTLESLLTPPTFKDLNQFTAARNIPVAAVNQFKPGMVMVALTLAEIQRLGVGGAGVDEFYFAKGRKDGRPMDFLEAPMDQVAFLAGIGIGQEDEMIAYILRDVEKLPTLLPVMKKAWKTGDNDLLYRETLAPLKKEYPDLYFKLMVKRNLAWMDRIMEMMATPEVEFILVGAGHLAGDRGLLALLKEKGFSAGNL